MIRRDPELDASQLRRTLEQYRSPPAQQIARTLLKHVAYSRLNRGLPAHHCPDGKISSESSNEYRFSIFYLVDFG